MTPEEYIYNANRAKEVLENEEFKKAFEDIEKEVIEQWTNSPARDEAGREKLWSYLHLLRKVRMHLQSTLESGKLAQINLQEQTRLQQVKQWIGIGS